MNAGYLNAGYLNAGYLNAGYAGYLNAGYLNAGVFNGIQVNAGAFNGIRLNQGAFNGVQINGLAVATDDPSEPGGADPTVTPVTAVPDLSIAKSDGGVSVVPDGVVAYLLAYANDGDQAATGVVLGTTAPGMRDRSRRDLAHRGVSVVAMPHGSH